MEDEPAAKSDKPRQAHNLDTFYGVGAGTLHIYGDVLLSRLSMWTTDYALNFMVA
jgi:hypothetical protein